MPAFLYRCPNTGLRVQGFIADDVGKDADSYKSITCLACQQVHLVNPMTGKVPGQQSGQDDH